MMTTCNGRNCQHVLGGKYSGDPKKVWMPAQTLYDLRRAAGGEPKPPLLPGRIVRLSRLTVELLRAKAAAAKATPSLGL